MQTKKYEKYEKSKFELIQKDLTVITGIQNHFYFSNLRSSRVGKTQIVHFYVFKYE